MIRPLPVSDDDIRELRLEALEAGDHEQADLCCLALGDCQSCQRATEVEIADARRACVEVILYARHEADVIDLHTHWGRS